MCEIVVCCLVWFGFHICNHCHCSWVTLIGSAELLPPVMSGCNPHRLMNDQVGFQVQSKLQPDSPTLSNTPHCRDEGEQGRVTASRSLAGMIMFVWWKKKQQGTDETACRIFTSWVWFTDFKSLFGSELQQQSTVSAAISAFIILYVL